MPQWTFSPTAEQEAKINRMVRNEIQAAHKMEEQGKPFKPRKRTDIIRDLIAAGIDDVEGR